MSTEIAIDVANVTICYKTLNKLGIKNSFFSLRKNKREIYKAVDDVSFSIKKGDIVGIVGKNGSGKSTILKSIAGIFSADEGSIDLHGHSVSLLAIGIGFQKNLTGRENIILSGLLLGFSEKQIVEKMSDIIEFSELEEFIDKPVKTYSSGMHSKLAFSIAVNLETDILLIDEVLSVGDAKFRKKSLKRMKELISQGNRTVVIVSHNSNMIRELCNTVIWMHKGKVKSKGPVVKIMDKYDAFMQ